MDRLIQSVERGFSLVELLISLALVGILAAFTIPALFNTPNSTLDKKQTAMAKDVAYMILAAFEQYRAAHPNITTMRASDLEPYLNYVKKIDDGVYQIDGVSGEGANTCSATRPCYTLHNGGMLHYWGDGFCNGSPTGLPFSFAPTSTYSGTTNGPYKAIRLFLYSDGAIRTGGTMKANTVWNSTSGQICINIASSVSEPDWFTGL